MSYPVLSRAVVCGDLDADGNVIVCGREYDPEWLRPNFLINGGWESGVDYGWTRAGAGAAGITVDITDRHSGMASARWVVGAGVTAQHKHNAYIPIRAGRDYILSVWTKFAVGAIRALLWWYDSEMQYMGAAIRYGATSSIWSELRATITPPAGAVYAYFLIENNSQCDGRVDDAQFFPSLDERRVESNAWAQDTPTFSVIYAGMVETFTLDRHWSLGSGMATDDPTTYITRLDGSMIMRANGTQKRTHALVSQWLPLGYAQQLELLQHKSLGQIITYTDSWGRSYSVRWPGGHSVMQLSNPAAAAQTLTLVEDDPAWH